LFNKRFKGVFSFHFWPTKSERRENLNPDYPQGKLNSKNVCFRNKIGVIGLSPRKVYYLKINPNYLQEK
jgi:hypothetical protein